MREVIMYPRPAYCAATVAIAAPLIPIPSQGTSTRSPRRFKAPANQTALRGVTASLSPKHAAWATFVRSVAGVPHALMAEYASAPLTTAPEDFEANDDTAREGRGKWGEGEGRGRGERERGEGRKGELAIQ
jgi:hypothetical protein